MPETESLRRFDAGDTCYVVARGATLATVFWVHDGPCYVRGLGHVLDGAPGARYVYGVATDPAHRGRGLFRNAIRDVAARLFSDGATRLVVIVMDGNAPVLTTLPRLGYRPTQHIRSLRVLGMRWTAVAPVGPGLASRTWRVVPPPGRFVI